VAKANLWYTCGKPYMTQWKNRKNYKKNMQKKQQKLILTLPVHTSKPVVWVHDMLWCAKIYYCIHTHATYFGNTAGFSVPMLNPTTSQYQITSQFIYWAMAWSILAWTQK
jgi:hypothetical protein